MQNRDFLGQSLLTKLVIMYAVAIRLVICIMDVIYVDILLLVHERCPYRTLRAKYSCVPAFVPGRKEPFEDVVVYACTKSTSSLTRFLFFPFGRLSIVVERCCWRVPN